MISDLRTKDYRHLELDDESGRLWLVAPNAQFVAFTHGLLVRVDSGFTRRAVIAEGLSKEACLFLIIHAHETSTRDLRFLLVRARCAAIDQIFPR